MPAKFQINRAKNGSFYFNLLAANGEVVLTSQMYVSKATAKKGIASVQNNASEPEQFESLTNKAGKHYFVLKAKNRQVVGTGQAYSGSTAVKNGIKSVAKNAPKAAVEDES
ncbi:MAG: YegP family protein [Rubripirellula sp.]|nr:YegP family protein [Rubripirellula sp.]